VRLTGVKRYSQNSLALLQVTAAAITARTGLHVDILDGSSVRSVAIATSPRTGPIIQSSWRVVGVAVQIVHGLDALQETLLVLCSLVCLLAIGVAGVLVGIGRREEALLLQHIGWQRYLLACTISLDALILCGPGCVLAITWIILASAFWPSSLPSVVVWLLLLSGIVLYCGMLVGVAVSRRSRRGVIHHARTRVRLWPLAVPFLEGMQDGSVGDLRPRAATRAPTQPNSTPAPTRYRSFSGDLHRRAATRAPTPPSTSPAPTRPVAFSRFPGGPQNLSSKALAGIIPYFICSIAITAAVFLIAVEYILIASFDQVLVVTVLGDQVREALEAPQLALLSLIVGAALLTVGLCMTLLLRGRREEMALLAKVGWERRAVILRVMRDSWWSALLSGEVGALLALGVTILGGALPPLLIIMSLLLCGPLVGVLLVSVVTIGPVWRETKRVFIWR